jgi:hypothetical protein
MNNAVEMVGIPEWSGFDYIVEVYDKRGSNKHFFMYGYML